MKLTVTVNGTPYEVDVEVQEEARPGLGSLGVLAYGAGNANTPAAPTSASVQAVTANAVVAPLAGSVAKVLVAEGDAISDGQVLVVLEAMKMETEITAPRAGTVSVIHVAAGDAVQGGQSLLELTD
ncbi:biotin/lipoyl-containing protein [Granulicoccus phenolivorans]|uniref:biotin/lipoyl-containing protein n=1 Tax=Granulicoccus phenolivorans TaxID=266854 RepID=UPI0003F8AD0B|nr:biotin/lipoyl-containing protein [Granulicoccus phenolivorans]